MAELAQGSTNRNAIQEQVARHPMIARDIRQNDIRQNCLMDTLGLPIFWRSPAARGWHMTCISQLGLKESRENE